MVMSCDRLSILHTFGYPDIEVRTSFRCSQVCSPKRMDAICTLEVRVRIREREEIGKGSELDVITVWSVPSLPSCIAVLATAVSSIGGG